MSSLNQNSNADFNTANIFKPQAAAGGVPMQTSPSGGAGSAGVTAAGMLSLASLFQNSIANSGSNNQNGVNANSMAAPSSTNSAGANAGGDLTTLNGAAGSVWVEDQADMKVEEVGLVETRLGVMSSRC